MGRYLTLGKTNASTDNKKKVNAKSARLKNIPLNLQIRMQKVSSTAQRVVKRISDCVTFTRTPTSTNLTCTPRPGSEQERGNLVDQSQYAVLWKWSVNEYS